MIDSVKLTQVGIRLAKDLLAVGDEFHSPAHRIQFMGGKYPDNEKNQGGLCEEALAAFFTTKLKEYLLHNDELCGDYSKDDFVMP